MVAAAMVVFSIAVVAFAISRNLWLSCATLYVCGFATMIQMGASNTLIQSMVPDELRGRVMSVYSMMYMGVGPLGTIFAGYAADRVGAPLTVAAGGGDLHGRSAI